MNTTSTETAEQTLSRLTRELRREESSLAGDEQRYMADGTYSDFTLARVRAELDIVRAVLEEIGEDPIWA